MRAPKQGIPSGQGWHCGTGIVSLPRDLPWQSETGKGKPVPGEDGMQGVSSDVVQA